MQKIHLVVRNGGSSKWPVHIVLLICEILVNGTPPYYVAANIQTMPDTITGIQVNEFPCINFVCQCRFVVRNMNYTLAALRLGDADE